MAKINAKKAFIITNLFIITVYLLTSRYIDPLNPVNMFISNQIEKIKARIEAKKLKPITSTGDCRIVNTIEAIWLVFKGITYTEEFCKTYKRK